MARRTVGISPTLHAIPPPVCWSASGVWPHVRPIAPDQSGNSRVVPVTNDSPKKACAAIVAKSSTSRSGKGGWLGIGSIPTSVCANRYPVIRKWMTIQVWPT